MYTIAKTNIITMKHKNAHDVEVYIQKKMVLTDIKNNAIGV